MELLFNMQFKLKSIQTYTMSVRQKNSDLPLEGKPNYSFIGPHINTNQIINILVHT